MDLIKKFYFYSTSKTLTRYKPIYHYQLRVKKRTILFTVFILIVSHDVLAQQKIRLINNWQFLRQDIGGIWEAVRPLKPGNPESVPLWDSVSLPHCVNERHAVDPDVNYYQGPAWYRTQIEVENPYKGGRTLLHFEGAGQKTNVYV